MPSKNCTAVDPLSFLTRGTRKDPDHESVATLAHRIWLETLPRVTKTRQSFF